ncbi:MAG: NAD(P)-dependent alcohol dehydrogenase [Actinomycetota bacterium]|nr:NAD(P)-dependent alcohol dehydrogenase [Actinomycetota bacterium]
MYGVHETPNPDASDTEGANPAGRMRAIAADRYGPPAGLELRDVPVPVPADDEVLMRVEAASVNPLDWHRATGNPYLMRLSEGLRRPALPLGNDVAGRVEAVGAAVEDLRPGDEVFGSCRGAFAELALASPAALVRRPEGVSAAAAAALPIAGATALQALRDKAALQPGESVLVIGASGGVGTFAVKLARVLGAGEVTAVCSGANGDLVRSLGADEVIDYRTTDVTTLGRRHDVVVDNAGRHPFRDRRRAMATDGRWVQVGFPKGPLVAGLDQMLWGKLLGPFGAGSFHPHFTSISAADLEELAAYVVAGDLDPVIGSVRSLAEVGGALEEIAGGHTRGKLVIDVLGR